MVTIHRAHGLRFMIFVDDHEPPHVHVFGGEMKIVIRGNGGQPEAVETIAMKTSDRRRAMEVVREEQDAFLAQWNEIHGARS